MDVDFLLHQLIHSIPFSTISIIKTSKLRCLVASLAYQRGHPQIWPVRDPLVQYCILFVLARNSYSTSLLNHQCIEIGGFLWSRMPLLSELPMRSTKPDRLRKDFIGPIAPDCCAKRQEHGRECSETSCGIHQSDCHRRKGQPVPACDRHHSDPAD